MEQFMFGETSELETEFLQIERRAHRHVASAARLPGGKWKYSAVPTKFTGAASVPWNI